MKDMKNQARVEDKSTRTFAGTVDTISRTPTGCHIYCASQGVDATCIGFDAPESCLPFMVDALMRKAVVIFTLRAEFDPGPIRSTSIVYVSHELA